METIFYAFFKIYSCRGKQVFGVVETYFFNESFIPAGGTRIFVYWKQCSFIYSCSFFLQKPLLALKSVSTCQNGGFSWNIVFTRWKKNYHWKTEKKMVSTSQKISCPLAIINCLKPASHSIPIMASTSRRVALIKKHCFH